MSYEWTPAPELQARFRAIVAALPGEWTEPEWASEQAARARHVATGVTLFLSFPGRNGYHYGNKGKVRAQTLPATCEADQRRVVIWKDLSYYLKALNVAPPAETTINLAPTKTDAQIAKDIARRLLDFSAFEAAKKLADERQAARDGKTALLGELAQMARLRIYKEGTADAEAGGYAFQVKTSYNGNEADVHVRGLAPDHARAVVKLLVSLGYGG